ncbi:hypothetical protein QQF64_025697 [Cirrhinus molitorella]|uniref:Uncharacterized protein n=1 Tax=Cirrhinus molitorella TaxID=172907 RepID=A0ABR3NQ33_9TELE
MGAAFSLEPVLFLELTSAETIKGSLFLSFMAYLRLVLLLCNKFGQRANRTPHKRQLESCLSRALYEVRAHTRPTLHLDRSGVVLGSRTHWTRVNMSAVIHPDHVLNAAAAATAAKRAELGDL